MENMEWAMAPSPERGLQLSLRSPGKERKVATKTKAVTIPVYPTKRSGLGLWPALGCGTQGRKPFSSLKVLAPPPRNSLFLPPELKSSKHQLTVRFVLGCQMYQGP